MQHFHIRGVIRNGQVVLDSPLDLPDGTLVSITEYDPDEVATVGPDPNDPEAMEAARVAALQHYLNMLKRRNLLSDSDGQTKIAG
jgi:hypothetical protein